jgi:hypothetical protein
MYDEDKRGSDSKGERAKGFGGLAYAHQAVAGQSKQAGISGRKEGVTNLDGLAYSFKATSNPDVPVDFNLWVLDSGATNFMHPDRKKFIDYQLLKVPIHTALVLSQ